MQTGYCFNEIYDLSPKGGRFSEWNGQTIPVRACVMHPLREVAPPSNGIECVAGRSHWFFFSLSLTLSEQVLVNPVVGTTHKQEQRILIDGGRWSRRGQATTSYLAPAAPVIVSEHVLVNPVVGAAHKQE